MDAETFKQLAAPFKPDDLDWRIARGGVKDGKPWAKCLAYVRRNAIENRLDEVVGPENWRNDYRPGADKGVMCGLSIRCGDEWVTKWDGSENTDIEAVKGGLSDSFKRAARCWGIGRYLWLLTEAWAEIDDRGEHQGQVKPKDGPVVYFRWNSPKLPGWALPEGYTHSPPARSDSKPRDKPPYGSEKKQAKAKPGIERLADALAAVRDADSIEKLTGIAEGAHKLRINGVFNDGQHDEVRYAIDKRKEQLNR